MEQSINGTPSGCRFYFADLWKPVESQKSHLTQLAGSSLWLTTFDSLCPWKQRFWYL